MYEPMLQMLGTKHLRYKSVIDAIGIFFREYNKGRVALNTNSHERDDVHYENLYIKENLIL